MGKNVRRLQGILGLYYAAYLVTTLPFDCQIKESLERLLLLQIYPLFLLLLFSLLRDPTTGTGTSRVAPL